MTTDRTQRSYRGSGVFILVSIPAGALAGGVTMLSLGGLSDGLFLGAVGFGAGAILSVIGVVGALVGGWLVAARTASLAWRGVGVAVGTAVVVGAAVAGFGLAAPGAIAITALVVAGLTLSATAPWRGGFARRIERPLAPPGPPAATGVGG